jgi:hypothetical protein
MSLLAWNVLGLLAGFIGTKLVNKTGQGVVLDIVLGSSALCSAASSSTYSRYPAGSKVVLNANKARVPAVSQCGGTHACGLGSAWEGKTEC